ncbi:MAG: hypothetical protein HXS54_03515 [Theionarchaea archaeon]|nr:hypothetical protein [Theionarchaea archaeon]
MNGNTDEIRMEIHSRFVKKHEYWVAKGKNWIARITGLDKRYGYKREFLETVRIGREKVFFVKDFCMGEIYEVVSLSKRGRIGVKDVFECIDVTETEVVLQRITQDEVIAACTGKDQGKTAENLMQLLQ